MPRTEISSLSDAARAWVFASDQPVRGDEAARVLEQVDAYLERWHAHGTPLTSAREWRDDRFLIVAVEGPAASGCSIDGLFRTLKSFGEALGANLVSSGLVFHRGADGDVLATDRPTFRAAASRGEITGETPVFDTSLTTLGDVRARFETPVAESWAAKLVN